MQSFIAANEQDFIGFKMELLLQQAGNDPLKRAEIINDIADTIALIPDQVKRAVYVQTAAGKFQVDEQVLYDRVSTAIRKSLEEQRKEEERQRFRESRAQQTSQQPLQNEQQDVPADYIPSPEFADMPDEPYVDIPPEEPSEEQRAGDALRFENPVTAPAEKDLLGFILRYGLNTLDFESDSEFYDSGEPITVADFIRDAIEDHPFANSLFLKTYEAYFNLYDSDDSLIQEDIVLKLMNGQERDIADFTASMVEEKHQLTVENFAKSMTTVSSRLVQNVPKAIMVYNSALVKSQELEVFSKIKMLSRNYTGSEEQQEEMEELLRKQQKLIELRKIIMKKLGRVQ